MLQNHADREEKTIRMYFEKAIHYPTLKTVIDVENVLRKSKKPMKRVDIKKMLKSKIMHKTLNIILAYLMERNMAINTDEGFVWIYDQQGVKKIEEKIQRGLVVKLDQ